MITAASTLTWREFLAVLGAFYLTAFLQSRRRVVFGILFATGALMLPFTVFILFKEGWSNVG
jgi:hypothetical protein